MNLLKIIVLFLLFLYPVANFGQENNSIPERTPEQEAAKQTEKLQQELNMSTEQARQVHEINLKYARARKVSNTRMDAIQRIKDKEIELSRVLDEQQQSVLQNKRYERSSFQSSESKQASPASRQPIDYQSQTNRSATTGTFQRSESQPGTNRQSITTRPRTTEKTGSTYRNPSEDRSSSVRSAAPSVNSAPRSSSRQSGVRSSTPTQQSPVGGRR